MDSKVVQLTGMVGRCGPRLYLMTKHGLTPFHKYLYMSCSIHGLIETTNTNSIAIRRGSSGVSAREVFRESGFICATNFVC
jgi:hypothetical protein